MTTTTTPNNGAKKKRTNSGDVASRAMRESEARARNGKLNGGRGRGRPAFKSIKGAGGGTRVNAERVPIYSVARGEELTGVYVRRKQISTRFGQRQGIVVEDANGDRVLVMAGAGLKYAIDDARESGQLRPGTIITIARADDDEELPGGNTRGVYALTTHDAVDGYDDVVDDAPARTKGVSMRDRARDDQDDADDK